MKHTLIGALLGCVLMLVIGAASVDTTGRFGNMNLSGYLTLSGETNRLTVADGALELDGTPIAEAADPFVITSQLADNETNVAARVNTSVTWAANGSKLLALGNNNTNVAWFTEMGGLGLGADTPALTDTISLYSLRNHENGDSVNQVFVESISDSDFTADAVITLATVASHDTNAHAAVTVAANDADANPAWETVATTGPLSNSAIRYTSGAGSMRLLFSPEIADGASAVAYAIDTQNALSTTGAKLLKASNAGTEKFSISHDGTPAVRTIPGITTTWTNMIGGVITQRITAVSGIIVTNLTL